jgi:hypothetical protein
LDDAGTAHQYSLVPGKLVQLGYQPIDFVATCQFLRDHGVGDAFQGHRVQNLYLSFKAGWLYNMHLDAFETGVQQQTRQPQTNVRIAAAFLYYRDVKLDVPSHGSVIGVTKVTGRIDILHHDHPTRAKSSMHPCERRGRITEMAQNEPRICDVKYRLADGVVDIGQPKLNVPAQPLSRFLLCQLEHRLVRVGANDTSTGAYDVGQFQRHITTPTADIETRCTLRDAGAID